MVSLFFQAFPWPTLLNVIKQVKIPAVKQVKILARAMPVPGVPGHQVKSRRILLAALLLQRSDQGDRPEGGGP